MQEGVQVTKVNKEPQYVAKIKSYNGDLEGLDEFTYYPLHSVDFQGEEVRSATGNFSLTGERNLFIIPNGCSHLNGGEWEFYEVVEEDGHTHYKLINEVESMGDLIKVEEQVNNVQPLKQPKPKKQKVWCVIEEDYYGDKLLKIFNSKKKAEKFVEKQLVDCSIVKMKVN